MSDGFIVKRWKVAVRWARGGSTTGLYIAATRGKALADAWRSDVFNGVSFGEFLKFSSCWRDHSADPLYGQEIVVGGKPAFFISRDPQYVQFVRPGSDVVMNSHPYDVEPEHMRPSTYRARDAA